MERTETGNWKMETGNGRNLKSENGNSDARGPVSNFQFRFSNDGYAFAILMIAVTLLLISLTAALPSVYTEAQREKEEELIFRGNQYATAIMRFRMKFGRFPNSVDELVKKTNGIRFLRQEFKDPMTKNGKWRFIHANAQGLILDSRSMPAIGLPGANPQNPGSAFNNPGSGFNNPGAGPVSGGQTFTGNPNAPPSAGGVPPDQESGDSQSGNQSAFSNQMGGAFIAGVASTSHKTSIKIWNHKTRYDEWEFLGVPQPTGGVIITQPPQPGGTGQNPGFGGQPTSPLNPGPPLQDPSNPQSNPQ